MNIEIWKMKMNINIKNNKSLKAGLTTVAVSSSMISLLLHSYSVLAFSGKSGTLMVMLP
jgi:hypothetical protein